jgi:hypothetical protein
LLCLRFGKYKLSNESLHLLPINWAWEILIHETKGFKQLLVVNSKFLIIVDCLCKILEESFTFSRLKESWEVFIILPPNLINDWVDIDFIFIESLELLLFFNIFQIFKNKGLHFLSIDLARLICIDSLESIENILTVWNHTHHIYQVLEELIRLVHIKGVWLIQVILLPDLLNEEVGFLHSLESIWLLTLKLFFQFLNDHFLLLNDCSSYIELLSQFYSWVLWLKCFNHECLFSNSESLLFHFFNSGLISVTLCEWR